MSIIYNTLERLEAEDPTQTAENPTQADNLAKTSSAYLAGKPRGGSIRAVAAGMMLGIAGAGLLVWQGNGQIDDSDGLQPPTTGSQAVVKEKPVPRLSLAPIGELASAPAQSAMRYSETETLAPQPAVPSASSSSGVVSETGKQRTSTNGASLKADSNEESLALAKIKPQTVNPPTVKSMPASTKQPVKIVPSGNAAQPDPVETWLEEARLALSRGQYQQALSSLETLSPKPKHRADFWLIKGSIHLGLGQLELAEQAFASAQALAPGNPQIAVQRAIINQEKGDHAVALQILRDAATLHSNVPEIYLNQGYSLQALGNERDAGRSFRVFLRLTEGRSLYAGQRKVVNEWLTQISFIPE